MILSNSLGKKKLNTKVDGVEKESFRIYQNPLFILKEIVKKILANLECYC